MAYDEFSGESPAALEHLKVGEKVKDDGAYYCTNCGPAKHTPMVNLKKGDMIPACADCEPTSLWTKV